MSTYIFNTTSIVPYMELDPQRLFGLHVHSCTHWQPPPLSPHIWPHIRGRYWSAKVDDNSLRNCAESAFKTIYVEEYLPEETEQVSTEQKAKRNKKMRIA
jgi:hypothetical protein